MLDGHVPSGFAPETGIDRINSYLISQMKEQRDLRPPQPGPAVTLSYQTGSGEHEVANRLAQILQTGSPRRVVPWTVYDGKLIERTLDEHHLPKTLQKFIPEDRRFMIEDMTDELLGLHPPEWSMVQKITETALHLANAGHVILVGWGTSFITAHMSNVFHARLIAPLSSRIERVGRVEKLSPQAAARFVRERDRGRRRYARAYFRATRNDQMYHLVVNTERIPCPAAARLIAEQAQEYFQNGAGAKH